MRYDITALRGRFGISQAKLGLLLGIDQSTVSRLETKGEVDGPVAKLLDQLSQYEELPDDLKREVAA